MVLYGTQGGNCNGCAARTFLPQHLTVDHIIARSKGGTDHLDNLQLLCGHCNSLKGDRPMEYLMARLAQGVCAESDARVARLAEADANSQPRIQLRKNGD